MSIAVLSVSLTVILGTVCSVFAQSDDIGSVLNKAQESLSKNTEDNIEPTVLESDYNSYENQEYNVKMQYPNDQCYISRLSRLEDMKIVPTQIIQPGH